MSDDLEIFRSRATLLRDRCVAAHNRLVRDAGYSSVSALSRSLAPSIRPKADNPRLRLLSSYTFWGDRRLGDSRNGFERRLERIASSDELELFERLKQSRFAAWECVDAPGGDEPSRWRAVGPPDDTAFEIACLLDGYGEPVEPAKGLMWAGWMVDWNETHLLAFAMRVPPEGTATLVETTEEQGWHDERGDDDEPFQWIEYYRDVLTQTLRPKWKECGIGEYYFLPPEQRNTFPPRFESGLPRRVVDTLQGDYGSVFIRLAVADEQFFDEHVPGLLDEARRKAAKTAAVHRGTHIDYSKLTKLVSDRDCLQWFGLDIDGTPLEKPYAPLESHPVEVLDLSDEWFASTGLGPQIPIGGVVCRYEDEQTQQARIFRQKLELHRERLRAAAMLHYISEHQDNTDDSPEVGPDYEQLQAVISKFFNQIIEPMPVARLIQTYGRGSKRVITTLEKAELGEKPRVVGQLPMRTYWLLEIPGIGPKSARDIKEALLEAIIQWPPKEGDGVVESAEARRDIDEGLEELEQLF